ncbi:hypothetical protein RvY_08065 [Ramazzottius varieornatus]|uniref:Ammonium transporter AmtB-like domain-containing protein n=1 Tax=Ramazzottius varieornatus TaxID=947166 RepID=A0A1D1VAA9_RAMVA|nr:hypothetical protein RvY_08065 [Ramazzottius varieornatus]
MWFGWLAAAAGSAGSSNTRAAMAAMVTAIAAAVGGLSWVWFDFIFTRKLGCLGFCSGVIAGLVGISPGAGFVAPWAAVVIGFLSSVLCNLWCRFRRNTHIDDTFETFTVHGCAGVLGMIFTGIFAQKWIGQLDGTTLRGGWVDHHWMQVPYQLVAAASVAAWSAAVTFILLFVINKIPGLHLRESAEEEEKGGDFSEMGEVAYMLLISEEGNAPANEGTIETLGERSDGKVISTASATRTADEPVPFHKETPFLDNLTLGHLTKKFYELNTDNEGGRFAVTVHKIPHGATVVQPAGTTRGTVKRDSSGQLDEVNVTKSNRSKVRMNPLASVLAPNNKDDEESRDKKESNGTVKDGQTDQI